MKYEKTVFLKDGRSCLIRSHSGRWQELVLMRLELN